jgi:hypothetical protein
VELPASLRHRVTLLNAEYALGRAKGSDAVWLACDLLVAGVDGLAVAELAAASTDMSFSDGEPLIVAMLDELGCPRLDPVTAVWTLARDAAQRLLAGEPEAGAELWPLLRAVGFPEELNLLTASLFDIELLFGTGRDDELDARWTKLAKDILRETQRLEPQR